MLNYKKNTMHQVDGEIRTTKEYDLFKQLIGNRKVKKNHVKKIKKSMQEKYIPTTVTVNERFEIIDGQHRYQAMKELNYPIRYVMIHGLTVKDAIRLNVSNSNWKLIDYIESWSEDNIPDYLILKDAIEHYNLGDSLIAKCMMSNTMSVNKAIEDGEFKINNPKWLEIVKAFIDYRENCQTYTHVFTSTILKSNDPADVLRTLKQKHIKGRVIQFRERSNDMKIEITSVYNHNNKKFYKELF